MIVFHTQSKKRSTNETLYGGKTMFPGFFRPKFNFYQLPNDWFDIWASIRQMTDHTHIPGMLKIVEYVIKWTWGCGNYDKLIHIPCHEFQYGKQNQKQMLDQGTHLSTMSVEQALEASVELGLLAETREPGNSGSSFLPHLYPGSGNSARLRQDVAELDDTPFSGFGSFASNYFLVPSSWTNLTCDITVATTILSVEYFFRHAWEENNLCWMDADDVSGGRRYRLKAQIGNRYDKGTGFSVDSIRNALNDAVSRGCLVWREKADHQEREYTLYARGMDVSEDGMLLFSAGKR